ncbi:ankyrin repeat-containing domain protein [Crepidotus variabilis]|uniref:Ankyrin repeat-containing domain protein n=1 Tax=Crepidotus variabilis TaxID=179855 RepID=A0A9P6E375_9AGAR|nr:ankyrin repeat-containing domain protein [Crepidotus variabilis]
MAIGQSQRPQKNIWVAAGDGDLDRVKASLSPNVPDPFTYTPMHAAASYGQIHVLEYLLSRGGDVNITDNEGDTPLYTVENVETARWLLQHGAVVARQNVEGISPIDHLIEDFPEVAEYLRGMSGSTLPPSSSNTTSLDSSAGASSDAVPPSSSAGPSRHTQNLTSEALTSSLMASVSNIMERAEREGRDPEEELRQAVGRTVLEGVLAGFEMSDVNPAEAEDRRMNPDAGDGSPNKRSRMNE